MRRKKKSNMAVEARDTAKVGDLTRTMAGVIINAHNNRIMAGVHTKNPNMVGVHITALDTGNHMDGALMITTAMTNMTTMMMTWDD